MIKADAPPNEAARLARLRSYSILDTQDEVEFDDLAHLAAQICGTPIALISLVDANRQWFKSKVGLNASEAPRELAFCAHAILEKKVFVVPNALEDERFLDNPSVTRDPKIRFYAGAPLTTPGGHNVGTLCVIDRVPNRLSKDQLDALERLGRRVVLQLESRLHNRQLMEQSAFQQTILANAAAGIISTSPSGIITHFNPAAEKMLGYTAGEMIGRLTPAVFHDPVEVADRATELSHDLGREILPGFEVFVVHARTKGEETREWTFVRKDGSRFPVMLSVSAMRDKSGGITGFLGIVRDISDRREADDRLRQSEALYQSLVASLPQCIMRKDREGRFTFVNQRFAEMLHVTPDEVMGHTDFDFYPKAMARKFRENDLQVMESGEIYETTEENMSPNGEVRDVHVLKIPVRDSQREVAGVQCVFRDVTEARRAQAEIQQREKMFQSIMDQMPAVIYLKDLDGRYVFVNREFETMFHPNGGEITAKSDYDIFAPDVAKRFRTADEMVMTEGKPVTLDEQVPQDDGLHDFLSIKFPISDLEGEPYRLCGISTDITVRKRFEHELKETNLDLKKTLAELSDARVKLFHAEKLMVIGTLAAKIAHDVGNPLQILNFGMDGLESLIPRMEEETEVTLNDMREAVTDANNIIKGLRDFSRLERLDISPTCVNQLVCDSISKVHASTLGKQVTIEFQESHLPMLLIDGPKMQEVLINLLNNSVQAVAEGGNIHVNTRCRCAGENETIAGRGDTSRCFPGNQLVTIEILDDGPGIPQDVLPSIFDLFFTTKPRGQGTGLGLPISQNIIALHSGAIDIQNRPQGGAHVMITLKHRKE